MTQLTEIAKLAGVSPRTAASVLSGEDRTRASAVERARRVRDAARKLGYRPNTAARSMRTGRFNVVSLILPASSSYFVPDQVLAINRALAGHDVQLSITQMPEADVAADPEALPRVLQEKSCDGFLVVWHNSIPPLAVRAVHEHESPAIWVNAKLESDCVYPDEYHAAARLIDRVAAAGHHRVAWLRHDRPSRRRGHFSTHDRERGLADRARALGLAVSAGRWPHRRDAGDHEANTAAMARAWDELLDRADRPTCLVAIQEMDAFAALRVAAERRLLVPDDLSLVMFAAPGVEVAYRGISHMHVPHAEMGRRAAEQLLKKIDRPQDELTPVALSHQWERCRTLAAPPDPTKPTDPT